MPAEDMRYEHRTSFRYDGMPLDLSDTFVIEIPAGIGTCADLLETYATRGRFPEYFGGNFNALRDCLCDFDWVSAQTIVIAHADVPLTDASDAAAYLRLLADVLQLWLRIDLHDVVVVFPADERATIVMLLAAPYAAPGS